MTNKERYQRYKEYHEKYRETHREERNNYQKQYYKENREEICAKQNANNQAHKEERKAYQKADVNSDGKTKNSIRTDSRRYLHKTLGFQKIDNYENHHCFGYENKKEFIYIPRWLHISIIHPFLRKNKIDADSNHFEQIKHILDNCNEPIFIIKDEKVTEY